MKISEISHKLDVVGEKGLLEIVYSLTAEDGQFGIEIENRSTGETACAPAISPDRSAVEQLLNLFAGNRVTPVTLIDIMEDILP